MVAAGGGVVKSEVLKERLVLHRYHSTFIL